MRVGSQSASSVTRGGEIDLHTLGRSLWSKRRKIVLPTLIVAVLAIVGVNVVTPRYESEARVIVEGRENVFLRPSTERLSIEDVRAQIDSEAVTSQAQVLQSRDVALAVIKELKLAQLPEFDPTLRGTSLVGSILALFSAETKLKLTPEERVLTQYYKRLSVLPIDKSRVIQIEFQSSDANLAARVVNTIVDEYVRFQRDNKVEQTRTAGQWLALEIEKLRPVVDAAERRVEDFRARANLFLGTNGTNLANQQLGELTSQLAAARAQKADLDARSRLIRDMLRNGRPIEAGDITNAELIRRLIEQRVTLRSQLAEQSSTLLDQHPRIKELRAQIGALDFQIRGEAEKLVVALENDARIAGARIETTGAAIDQLKRQIAGLNSQEIELRALEREAKAQRDLLETYLAKYREAATRDSLESAPADIRVISRAIPSNIPAFPKKIPIVAIATLATAFLAVTLIVTGDLLDPGNARPQPREPAREKRSFFARGRRKPAEPIVETGISSPQSAPAAAPASGARPSGVSVDDLARALRRIGEAGRRITVVGAARNVGTTFTAVGLGRALVQQGARTVLVDLSLAAPNIAVMSTDPDAPGISELVGGSAHFGDIVTRDRFSRLHLVAAGRRPADPAAVLASPRLAMTLEALATTYDHVLVDAGAIGDGSVDTMARLAPRAVLVATDLSHPDTRAARERLIGAGFFEVTILLGKTAPVATAADAA